MKGSTDTQDRIDAARIAAGQSDLFAQLHQRYIPFVHRIGLRILRSCQEIDDFEQDVFLNVFLHIGDFTGTGTLHGWIGKIACNTALNMRHRRLELTVPPDTLDRLVADSSSYGPEQQCIAHESTAAIRRAIQDLPKRYRDVVHMALDLDLTYSEISRLAGIPVGTLKAQMHRARAILYQSLDSAWVKSHNMV